MASNLVFLGRRIDRLAELTRGAIELRYSTTTNRWGVWTSQGNQMRLVHDTLRADPYTSITVAELRWQQRTPDNPF